MAVVVISRTDDRPGRTGRRLAALALVGVCALGVTTPTASAATPSPMSSAPMSSAAMSSAAMSSTATASTAAATTGATSLVPRRAVRPIPSLDLQRYQGRWLQLATIPAPFSAPCARDTVARYTVLPDGLVQVVNTCTSAQGATIPIEGRAQVTGPDSNAQLEVSFAPDGAGGFAFTGEANYWVIGIDRHEYSWAVVGNDDRTSGFVLSRESRLSGLEVLRVLKVLLANGYDPCAFTVTATTGGVEADRKLCRL